ncbi:bestrophin-like domain [Streptomyces lavendulae]
MGAGGLPVTLASPARRLACAAPPRTGRWVVAWCATGFRTWGRAGSARVCGTTVAVWSSGGVRSTGMRPGRCWSGTWAAEASAVSRIARDAEAFPPTTRAAVHDCVCDYVHAVVERQWPLMREGRGDAAVTAAGQRICAGVIFPDLERCRLLSVLAAVLAH